MDPIKEYIQDGKLSKNKEETRRVKNRSLYYITIGEVFYKPVFRLPYLLFVYDEEADYVLKEVLIIFYGKDIIGHHCTWIWPEWYNLVQDARFIQIFQSNHLRGSLFSSVSDLSHSGDLLWLDHCWWGMLRWSKR